MSVPYYTVKPAYGRFYSNADALVAAWNEGKDFLIMQGPDSMGRYTSFRDREYLKYVKLLSMTADGKVIEAVVDYRTKGEKLMDKVI